MSDFGDVVVAVIVALAAHAVVFARIGRGLEPDEQRFLQTTYAGAVALRSVVAMFLNAYAGSSYFAASFWGDSGTYDYGGHLLALYWKEELLTPPPATRAISGWGFHYMVGAVYYVFGQNRLLVQLLNALVGGLGVLVVYAIAKTLFDSAVARWAALFMAYFPQMIFWSAAIYKDPAVLLCIGLSMYAVLKLRERFVPRYVLLFLAAAFTLMSLRFYVFYMVSFATLGTFLFSQRRGAGARVASQVLLLVAFVGALSVAVRSETLERQKDFLDLRKLQVARADQSASAQSGYAGEYDVSTPGGALSALPVGLVYLLFAPFPWSIGSVRQLLTVPEMLVWYALFPSLVRGLRYAVKHRLRECLPVLVYALMLTLAYAVFQGNVGTAYRQRTQVNMFFFVFIGVGLAYRRRPASEAAPEALPLEAR